MNRNIFNRLIAYKKQILVGFSSSFCPNLVSKWEISACPLLWSLHHGSLHQGIPMETTNVKLSQERWEWSRSQFKCIARHHFIGCVLLETYSRTLTQKEAAANCFPPLVLRAGMQVFQVYRMWYVMHIVSMLQHAASDAFGALQYLTPIWCWSLTFVSRWNFAKKLLGAHHHTIHYMKIMNIIQ